MHRLGDFELHALCDGFFRLDGGAMFGIVPKPLWEKEALPDERNRVRLALNVLLIRTGRENVLVDAGIGEKFDADFLEPYSLERPPSLLGDLKGVGLDPGDVDVVILTHLHFDHAGGATRREGDRMVPTFPRAVYVMQEGMIEEALRPNPRTRRSYFEADFVPLRDAGLVRLARGEEEVVPGVRVLPSGGHVERHQMVLVQSRGRKAIFWGDVMPTAAHVRPAWTTGYDLFPCDVAALRQELAERSAAEGWVNVFDHDPDVAMGFFRRNERGFRVETVERVGRPG